MIFNSKFKKAAVFAICCAALAAAGGCGKNIEKVTTLSPESLKTASYPLKTDEVLTLWMGHNVGRSVSKDNDYNSYPRVEEMQKRTGVKVEITYADLGMEEEQFNMMLASGSLPDMIYYNWMNIPGGVDKAISDGYIAPLNDLMTEYSPNLCKFFDDNPDIAKRARTDSGNYYMYAQYTADNIEKYSVSSGYIMRKDMLDSVGKAAPETIEEWHDVLTAFKNELHIESPLSYNFSDEYAWRGLVGAYGIDTGFYQKNGRVFYGPAEPEYKDYLTEMNRWYREGLLDSNIVTLSDDNVEEQMVSGKSGAAFGWIGASIGTWSLAGKEKNSKYSLVGLVPPTLKKGDISAIGNRNEKISHIGVAITNSDKKELAAKFLDYGYSDEGSVEYNYGIEGISYEMKDGKPQYKEPDEKMSRSDFLTLYTFASSAWATKVLPGIGEYYYVMPEQRQAAEAFSRLSKEDYSMSGITPSVEEATEVSHLEMEINYYVKEMRTKFVLGIEPIDNFDAYIAKLNEMGLERLKEIKQTALDRYNRR